MNTAVTRKQLLQVLLDQVKLVSRIESQEIMMGPGAKAPPHLHPCPTVGIITEGQITFQMEGKIAQSLKTGDVFYEPAGVSIARFNNESASPAKFVVFYLLSRDEIETVRILEP